MLLSDLVLEWLEERQMECDLIIDDWEYQHPNRQVTIYIPLTEQVIMRLWFDDDRHVMVAVHCNQWRNATCEVVNEIFQAADPKFFERLEETRIRWTHETRRL